MVGGGEERAGTGSRTGPEGDDLAVIPGLAAIAPTFDLVLCDIWGVLHDGLQAFAPAGEALIRFRALPPAAPGAGGPPPPRRVVLVTNAPRGRESIVAMLRRLDVPDAAYDAIVTSGDLTRDLIAARAGAPVHHLGPERDVSVFAGPGGARLVALEEADYVVCTGLFHDEVETVEDYRERLARMRARGLVMICANPDVVVERGTRLIPCAGALAAAYEALGGEVIYAGKPHRPVYDAALGLARSLDGRVPPLARVLAIGDALRTDIAGARSLGCRSLLVARGIHAAEIEASGLLRPGPPARNAAWPGGLPQRPDYLVDSLVWA